MRLANAYGSELLPMQVPLRNEYFVNNGYVINGDDSCTQTSVPVSGAATGQSALLFGALTNSNHLQAGQTTATLNGQSGTGVFVQGNGKLWLSKPGASHDGYVDILMAAPSYLQYDWGAGLAGPRARARFGIYKGAGPLIDMREIY
jgi:MSHA biogenesis protein MshQ